MLEQDKKDLKKIHRLMNTEKLDLRFAWLPNNVEGDYDGETISIDSYKLILVTMIHEYLHDIYPKVSEKLVDKRAYRIYHSMTKKQRKYLYRKLELYAREKYKRG